jgi:hypothetical protein
MKKLLTGLVLAVLVLVLPSGVFAKGNSNLVCKTTKNGNNTVTICTCKTQDTSVNQSNTLTVSNVVSVVTNTGGNEGGTIHTGNATSNVSIVVAGGVNIHWCLLAEPKIRLSGKDMKTKTLYLLSIKKIILSNSKVDMKKVMKIAKELSGDKFKAVPAYFNGKSYILTDGNHRVLAGIMRGVKYIPAIFLTKKEFDYVKYSKRSIDFDVHIPKKIKII